MAGFRAADTLCLTVSVPMKMTFMSIAVSVTSAGSSHPQSLAIQNTMTRTTTAIRVLVFLLGFVDDILLSCEEAMISMTLSQAAVGLDRERFFYEATSVLSPSASDNTVCNGGLVVSVGSRVSRHPRVF